MSFFHKKMSQNLWATIMPFGPVTNILLAQNFFFNHSNYYTTDAVLEMKASQTKKKFWASKILVTGPNGIIVAHKFCDIFL
jgi:hypothetical protein